jgi:methyl-accepting chemotaxis protein
MKGLIERFSVHQKLWVLVAFSLLGAVVVSFQGLMYLKANMLNDREAKVQHLVEVAHGMLQYYANLAEKGRLSEEAAKREATQTIKNLRYGGDNYFWITDMTPVMIMHPFKPELDGKDLSESKDPTGKHLFVEMVATVKREGSGFVAYRWPKPGAAKPVAKISYVKGFTPWGWIVGSGIYIDDVDAVFMQSALKEGAMGAGVLGVTILIAVLIVRNLRTQAAETDRIEVALDNVSGNVMVADAKGKVIYLNRAVETMFRQAEQDVRREVATFNVAGLVGSELDRLYEDLSHQSSRLSQVNNTENFEFEVGGRTFRIVANPVLNDKGERLGTAVEWKDRTDEVSVEREVHGIVRYAQSGDLSQRIVLEGKTGFFAPLSEGINSLLADSERVINDTLRVLAAMAGGSLTETISAEYQGTFGQLKRDANTTVVRLTEVIGKIKAGAESVRRGADEISQGNANLSQRTEEQASSLEETASSMEEMTATVKQNADNARQANQLAAGARAQAEKGGQVVSEAVSAMGEINTSSKQIADIIGVIDEIAFQTNLLALNAAVEAARAGEQGRGFAVVASEVRNLAQRSATAAKEIKELIKDSVAKVDEGSQLVDKSGQTLDEIVVAVKKVSDIVAEIAAASAEQSSGIEQVNKAIMQMDEMTQQNAALVEQAAAASEAMDEQARSMKGLTDFFKVDEQAVAAAAQAIGASSEMASIDFGEARSKHLMWKSRLRRFLDGQEAMSKDQAVSHKHCDLGKWLYSQGLKRYGQLQEMQELEKVHQRLHGVIQRIVEFKHGGRQEQAEHEFKQVEPISQKVVSLLNAVERQANQESAGGTKQGSDKQVERRSANRPWVQPQAATSPKPTPRQKSTGTDGDPEWEEF